METSFYKASIQNTIFSRADCTKAIFDRAHIDFSDFSDADLTGADFTYAEINGDPSDGRCPDMPSSFARVRASGSDFSHAQLYLVDAPGGDFSGANLS